REPTGCRDLRTEDAVLGRTARVSGLVVVPDSVAHEKLLVVGVERGGLGGCGHDAVVLVVPRLGGDRAAEPVRGGVAVEGLGADRSPAPDVDTQTVLVHAARATEAAGFRGALGGAVLLGVAPHVEH